MPGKVKVKIVAGRNLPVMDRSNDTTDAYVEVKLGSTTFKTDVCRKSLNPQWNSEWFRFEMDDLELQDEPLQIRLMDYDTYSANDAIGKVYLDLNPLLLTSSKGKDQSGRLISGWIPVYDTMHGIRGEVNLLVKVELFTDVNKFRQSSCGVMFFFTQAVPEGYVAHLIHGFVEELVVNDDPEYQWIDKIRTPRASNEARQTLFSKLSGEVQRRVGLKALELGGNAVIGYRQCFDLEGESGIVVRGIGTAVTLVKQYENQLSPSGIDAGVKECQVVDGGLVSSSHPWQLPKNRKSKMNGYRDSSYPSMPNNFLYCSNNAYDSLASCSSARLPSVAALNTGDTDRMSLNSLHLHHRPSCRINNATKSAANECMPSKSSKSSSRVCSQKISSSTYLTTPSDNYDSTSSLSGNEPDSALQRSALSYRESSSIENRFGVAATKRSVKTVSFKGRFSKTTLMKHAHHSVSGGNGTSELSRKHLYLKKDIFKFFRSSKSNTHQHKRGNSVDVQGWAGYSRKCKETTLRCNSDSYSCDQTSMDSFVSEPSDISVDCSAETDCDSCDSGSRKRFTFFTYDDRGTSSRKSPSPNTLVHHSVGSNASQNFCSTCMVYSGSACLCAYDGGCLLTDAKVSEAKLDENTSLTELGSHSQSLKGSQECSTTTKIRGNTRKINLCEQSSDKNADEVAGICVGPGHLSNKTVAPDISCVGSNGELCRKENLASMLTLSKTQANLILKNTAIPVQKAVIPDVKIDTSNVLLTRTASNNAVMNEIGNFPACEVILHDISSIPKNNQDLTLMHCKMTLTNSKFAKSSLLVPKQNSLICSTMTENDGIRLQPSVAVNSCKELSLTTYEHTSSTTVSSTVSNTVMATAPTSKNSTFVNGTHKAVESWDGGTDAIATGKAGLTGDTKEHTPGHGVSRRLSDSELATSSKSQSNAASTTAHAVAGGNHGKTLTFAPIPHRRPATGDHFDMLEYPFITLNLFPPGFVLHLGGTVSARSVKLLERISNLDEPESRDSWWTEIRMEIRSHARSIGCNVVLGYEEHTTMCDDVCILSASGTAAIVNYTPGENSEGGQSVGVKGGSTTDSLCPCARTDRDKALTSGKTEHHHGCPKSSPKTKSSVSDSLEPNCQICHIPYNEGSVPFPVSMSRCSVCKKGKVPDILLATVDLPSSLPTCGKSCLIQAQVFRPKKDCKGEVSAKEVSDSLPFLEYELHRRLINKLKVRGMNAIFALQVQICLGEKLMVGLATGTAVYLSSLPPPSVPKISAGNMKTDSQKVAQFQKVVQEAYDRNREVYHLKQTSLHLVATNGNQYTSSDGEESDEDLPDIDLSSGNKDTYVLEVDDAEDIDIIQVLIDPSPELNFCVNNTNFSHDIEDRAVIGQQMFTQIWRCRISSTITLRQFTNYFDKLLQAVTFKLRRISPCVLSKLRYRVELPEQDEMQLSIIGLAIQLQDKANGDIKNKNLTEHSDSSARTGEGSNHESNNAFITAQIDASAGSTASIGGQTPTFLTCSLSSGTINTPRTKMGNKVFKRQKCIEITPLPHVPGRKIDKYLGNLNFFFIRETTSIRENGGLSGFVHSFVAEMLAIVRAHVSALGGNAMVSYFMTELALLHNPHKNQGQCLVNVGGDVVILLASNGSLES